MAAVVETSVAVADLVEMIIMEEDVAETLVVEVVASVDEVDMEAIATIMDLVMMVDMATTHLMAVAIAAMVETKVMEEAKEVVVDMEEMVAVAAAMMATTVEVVVEE